MSLHKKNNLIVPVLDQFLYRDMIIKIVKIYSHLYYISLSRLLFDIYLLGTWVGIYSSDDLMLDDYPIAACSSEYGRTHDPRSFDKMIELELCGKIPYHAK
jgi:hypothetical protein